MELLTRNYHDVRTTGRIELITATDKPLTCLMSYESVAPGQSSGQLSAEREHEVYVLDGDGILVTGGSEFAVRDGDGVLIKASDSSFRNTGNGMLRLLIATGLTSDGSTEGRAVAPFIRNYRDVVVNPPRAPRVIGSADGASHFLMLHNAPLAPGAQENEHTHPWGHSGYLVSGAGVMVCGGKRYLASEGAAVLVPPATPHYWRNEGNEPIYRVTFNDLVSEGGH